MVAGVVTRYWPRGLAETLAYPDVEVGALLRGAANRFPDRCAVRDGADSMSYAELFAASSGLARALARAGFGRGDVVALHSPNCLQYVVSYYAVMLSGATACLTSPLWTSDELSAVLADTGATGAVTHAQCAPALAGADGADALGTVVVIPGSTSAPAEPFDHTCFGSVGFTMSEFVAGVSDAPMSPTTDVDSVAQLAFTGGTTGVPKAVVLHHSHVVACALAVACWRSATTPRVDDAGGVTLEPTAVSGDYPVTPGDEVFVVGLPLFHAFGMNTLNAMIVAGATVVVIPRFTPAGFLESLAAHRGTYVGGSPALWHSLVECPDVDDTDLGSVTTLVSGAAPIDSPTLIRTVPARRRPTWRPTMVISGNPAFRPACRPTTYDSATFLARAVRTYSLPSSWWRAALNVRICAPASPVARVNAGSSM